MSESEKLSRIIQGEQQNLAEEIVARQYERQPTLCKASDSIGREKSVRDVGYHLAYLSEAIAAADPSLFAEYTAWVKTLFAGLGFSDDALTTTLACTRETLADRLPESLHPPINQTIDAGLEALKRTSADPPNHIEAHSPLSGLAQRYMDALLAGDRHTSSKMILSAVDHGVLVRDIYLLVFQPVQREIGRLWQTNQISVAQEHYCTAATQLIMSQLYPRIFSAERTGYRLVATCVGGELHEIGVRMVADFFEMDGWDTYYLGANTPTEGILSTIETRQPDVLGISATITMHVSDVRALIKQVRASDAGENVKILVGGYPFNVAPDLWRRVDADGHASDAQQAVAIANQWMNDNEH